MERTLDPYSLVCKANIWYLLAFYNGKTQSYRVSRIQTFEVLEETFVRSEGFDLNTFWADQLEQYKDYAPPFECALEIKAERVQFLTWPFIYNYEINEKASREGWQTVSINF